MSGDLEGRSVLVTGASEGIGRATALVFAREGSNVVAVARSRERLESLAAGSGDPSRIVPMVADVTDDAEMEALAARVLATVGVPDVIVANAGLGMDAPFRDTSVDAFRRILDVNVLGVVRTVRPFLPGMIERGSGRILLVSSVVGKRGVPSYSAYSASKFALHGIADAVRPELRGTGVSLGVVCPSSTDSEFDARKIREGQGQGKFRVAKHSAESVARAIVRMARSRRREHVLSTEGKLMVFANALFPGLIDRILARVLLSRSR